VWRTLGKKIFVQVSCQRAFGLPWSQSLVHVRDYGFLLRWHVQWVGRMRILFLDCENGNQVAQGNGQFTSNETKEFCVDSDVSPTRSPLSASPSASLWCTNTNETFKIKIGKKKTTTSTRSTCDEFESIKKSKQRNSARRILLLRLTLPFAISSALLATMRSSSKDQWQETHVQEESQQ